MGFMESGEKKWGKRQERAEGVKQSGMAGMREEQKEREIWQYEGVLYIAIEECITYSAAMSHHIPFHWLWQVKTTHTHTNTKHV